MDARRVNGWPVTQSSGARTSDFAALSAKHRVAVTSW